MFVLWVNFIGVDFLSLIVYLNKMPVKTNGFGVTWLVNKILSSSWHDIVEIYYKRAIIDHFLYKHTQVKVKDGIIINY